MFTSCMLICSQVVLRPYVPQGEAYHNCSQAHKVSRNNHGGGNAGEWRKRDEGPKYL